MDADECAKKVDEIARAKDKKKPEYDDMVKLGKALVGKKDVTDSGPCKETIKEEKPTTSEEDDISDRDTNQEEEEEGQIDIQNQATMEAFKLKIQRPFIELYLKYKEAQSESPSPDEVDEALIQVTTGYIFHLI